MTKDQTDQGPQWPHTIQHYELISSSQTVYISAQGWPYVQ